MMSWPWRPPSDQELKFQTLPLIRCPSGALMLLRDPMITVLVNVVVPLVPLNVSCALLGSEVKVRTTVLGSRRSVVEPVSPPESVAVKVSSMYDGYSWSGAKNESPAVPVQLCRKWVWQ